MLKLEIYAIYDKKSKCLDTPFFAVSEIFAKRRFVLMYNEGGSLKEWPEDFQLWKLGEVYLEDHEDGNGEGGLVQEIRVVTEAAAIAKEKEEK